MCHQDWYTQSHLNHSILRVACVLLIALALTSCNLEDADFEADEVDQWIHYTSTDGLAGNRVQAIYEDSLGNIWFGHIDDGLSVFDGNSIQTLDQSDGLIDNTVYAITHDQLTGQMWFGTAGGLAFLDPMGNWTGLADISGFTFEVYALLRDSNKNIWIGTDALGFWILTPTDFQTILDPNCIFCNTINAFEETTDGTIWIGTGGGLKQIENGNETLYTVSDGLPDNDVTSVYQDSWGNIWTGTFFGKDVTYFDGTDFQAVPLYNGISINAIFSINQETSGQIWIGSAVGGLMYYDGSIVRTVDNAVDPGNIAVLAMFEDSQKNLWIGTDDDGLWLRITP